MKSQTTKASNYEKVKQSLQELGGESLIKKVPREIQGSEKLMFHVVLLSVKMIPGSLKNDVRLNIVQYHRRGFEKIQESFTNHADKMFVLHNPDEAVEEKHDEDVDLDSFLASEPSIEDMRTFSKKNKLSLKGAKSKEDIIEALKNAISK